MTERKQPETASEWLIALREAPEDPQLRAGFDAWLAADTENLRNWHEISHTYDLLGRLGSAPETSVREHAARRKRGLTRRVAIGLAGAGIAASLAVFVAIGVPPTYDADYATSTAEDKQIELSDGSSLHLGPESAVAVDFADDRRTIRLFSGEAFFDVAHLPTKPFHVVTEDLDTRVTGTAFEVQLTGESTTVAVQEGAVEVSHQNDRNEPEQLQAGDWLRLSSNNSLQRGWVQPEQVAAWRRGRLIVKDRSVAEVVSLLRRYHSGMVLLPGDSLARRSVTGVYDLADPNMALRAVASAQEAQLREFTPWIVVLSE